MRLTLLGCLLAMIGSAGATGRDGLVIAFHEVTVCSPVQEIIEEVLVREGDAVNKGTPLIRLLQQRELLEVQRSEAVVEKTAFDAKASQALAKDRLVPAEQAIEKEVEHRLAGIELAQAKVRLAEKTIVSGIDGIVARLYKEAGESVDRVEKVAEVVNIERVYLKFLLDQAELVRLRAGMRVPVRVPLVPELGEVEAVVDFVDPVIDAASGLFRVKLLLDNPGLRLRPGMKVEGDFGRAAGGQP